MAKQGKYVPLCVRYDFEVQSSNKTAKIQPLVSAIDKPASVSSRRKEIKSGSWSASSSPTSTAQAHHQHRLPVQTSYSFTMPSRQKTNSKKALPIQTTPLLIPRPKLILPSSTSSSFSTTSSSYSSPALHTLERNSKTKSEGIFVFSARQATSSNASRTLERQTSNNKGLRRNRSRSVCSVMKKPSFRCIPECSENEDESQKRVHFS